MTPGTLASRKKPVCHTCGYPMAGHKRPNGSPVCPRESASPSPSQSRSRSLSRTPARDSTEPPSLLSRISPPGVTFSPTPSGYWHRQNPNWVVPEHYARIPSHAVHHVPQRGDTVGSWESTELDEPPARFSVQARLPPAFPQAEEDDEIEEIDPAEDDSEDADTQRTVSPAPSNSFSRLTRGFSKILGRSVAKVYSAPSEDVVAIEHAAREQGLHTGVARRRATVKAEPLSPAGQLSSSSPSTLSREDSWWIFVGRDRAAVNALTVSHAAPTTATTAREPYDFDAGLVAERNEKVGTYPADPRTVRQNYCDVIVAGIVSAFCVVWLLSYM
ncbi:hypothetical protein BD413DRAFT_526847 [Trametes elegans]|nr:hypothetical protein BD413DRAFT_526847 [Trametes elegans]